MSSAGAKCNHLNHVSTQMPYALTVAAISFVMYLVSGGFYLGFNAMVKAGFLPEGIANAGTWIIAGVSLLIGTIITIGTLLVIRVITKKAERKEA